MERFDGEVKSPQMISVPMPESDSHYLDRREVLVNSGEKEAAILTATNTSTKNVVLLLIPNEYSISLKELYEQFHQIYESTEFEVIESATILAYCHHFIRNGLVREQVTTDAPGAKRAVSFSLTGDGNTLGRPAAALALHFEFNQKLSLLKIFGSARSTKETPHTASYNRARIIRYLAQGEEPVRACEIARELHMGDAVVSRTLRALESANVLERETVGKSTFVSINATIGRVTLEYLELMARLIDGDDATLSYLTTELIPRVTGGLSNYARELSPSCYEHSNSHKMRKYRKNIARMLSFIAQSSQGTTVAELSELLNLNPSTIHHDLAPYVKNEQIVVLVKGGRNYYYFVGAERAFRSRRGRSAPYWRRIILSESLPTNPS